MRLKRNIITCAYAGVFILIMLLGLMHLSAEGYQRFAEDGMEWIFVVLASIGVILTFIFCFLLREKAALRGIQDESAGLIVLEGFLIVALVGAAFYLTMSYSIETGLWVGAYLALVYAVSRMLGGRLCGLLGAGFSFAIVYFCYDAEWVEFSQKEMIKVFTFLVPFFIYLLMVKVILPQFAKKGAVIIFSMLVLGAVFGTAIVLNPITVFLCLGCALAMLFGVIRQADTRLTKGPVLAILCVVFSGIAAFGVSLLLEKDFINLFSFSYEKELETALYGGNYVTYCLGKFHEQLNEYLFHSFDYGIAPMVFMLLAAMGGVYTIRRKLSAMGPMLLSLIAVMVGYIAVAPYGSHCFYLTYFLGLYAAYGLYNMLLPEFLSKFEDEDEEFEDDDTDVIPSVDNLTETKEEVSDENHKSGSSKHGPVSEAQKKEPKVSEPLKGVDVPATGVDYTPPSSDSDSSAFLDWHVSEEFVREDKLKKERQKQREEAYEAAKAARAQDEAEQQAAEAAAAVEEEKPTEGFVFGAPEAAVAGAVATAAVATPEPAEQPAAEASNVVSEPAETETEETKPESSGNTVFTFEDTGSKPYMNAVSDNSVVDSTSADAPLLDMNSPQSNDEFTTSSGVTMADEEVAKDVPDMSQLGPKYDSGEQELSESHRDDSDNLVLSGYQNDAKLKGAADILSAINETEVPTVQIPDVPEIPEPVSAPEPEFTEAPANTSVPEPEPAVTPEPAPVSDQSIDGFDFTDASAKEESDPQLDSLLDRLDMSDSIKRMNASAREDMADVIERADDKTEDEVVLHNEAYNFGKEDGEYGQVPTVSDLEDRWRAEQQLKEVPEDQIPDVVPADESMHFTSMDASRPDDFMTIPEDESVSDFTPADVEPEVAPVAPGAAKSFDEIISAKPEPTDDDEDEDDSFVSFSDMAHSMKEPEEVQPKAEAPHITPFEPERIARTAPEPIEPVKQPEPEFIPEPVANHPDKSPVYSFTSKDVDIDVRSDEGRLGIPKPGREPISDHVRRYAQGIAPDGRPMAAGLDDYEKKKTDKPVHTEEVTRKEGAGSRSYHRIVIK